MIECARSAVLWKHHKGLEMENLRWLLDNGYRVVTRNDFELSCAVPGLVDRVKPYKGIYVVYDPHSDIEGFILVKDDLVTLCRTAYEHLAS